MQHFPFGHRDVGSELLEHGADATQPGKSSNGLLAAFAAGHEQVLLLFVQRQMFQSMSLDTILHEATRCGFDSVIRLILKINNVENNSDSDLATDKVQTALHCRNFLAARTYRKCPTSKLVGAIWGMLYRQLFLVVIRDALTLSLAVSTWRG